MKGFFGMGKLSSIVPNALILNDIWLYIQAIRSIEDKVTLFFNLCMCNKACKQHVDNSEDWFDYQVFLAEYLFEQQQLEK
jgi:hypothetical protein